METPFIFGKIATKKNFTDREKERNNRLSSELYVVNQHDYYLSSPLGEEFSCK